MRFGIGWLLLCFPFTSMAVCAQDSLFLLPVPSQVVVREGSLRIDSTFRATLTGHRDPLLERAVGRLVANLAAKTGLDMVGGDGAATSMPGLRVRCDGPDPNFLSPAADESYRLEVTPKGAELYARALTGILRRTGDIFSTGGAGSERVSRPRRRDHGQAPLCLARADDRCEPPLHVGRRDPAAALCHGSGETQRLASASYG